MLKKKKKKHPAKSKSRNLVIMQTAYQVMHCSFAFLFKISNIISSSLTVYFIKHIRITSWIVNLLTPSTQHNTALTHTAISKEEKDKIKYGISSHKK